MQETITELDERINKWWSRLRRAVNAIEKLEQKKRRLAKPRPARLKAEAPPVASSPPSPPVAAHDLDVPGFLRRNAPTPEAAAILAEQAERKAAKARGRIATMKAKKAGDLARMPLTGKAALAAIRGA